MAQYSVICTDFESGKDYHVEINADTPESAVKEAIAKGHLTDGRVADQKQSADITTHYARPEAEPPARTSPSLEQTVMRLEEELVRLSTKVDNLSDGKWLEWRIGWGVFKGLMLFSVIGFVLGILGAIVVFFVIAQLAGSKLSGTTNGLPLGGLQQQLDSITEQLQATDLLNDAGLQPDPE